MRTPAATNARWMRSSKRWGVLADRNPLRRLRGSSFGLLFLQPCNLDFQELVQGLALLGLHLREEDGGAEDVFALLAVATDLNERAQDFARDVNAAVAWEDQ